MTLPTAVPTSTTPTLGKQYTIKNSVGSRNVTVASEGYASRSGAKNGIEPVTELGSVAVA
jgi:hypothetical protein